MAHWLQREHFTETGAMDAFSKKEVEATPEPVLFSTRCTRASTRLRGVQAHLAMPGERLERFSSQLSIVFQNLWTRPGT